MNYKLQITSLTSQNVIIPEGMNKPTYCHCNLSLQAGYCLVGFYRDSGWQHTQIFDLPFGRDELLQ